MECVQSISCALLSLLAPGPRVQSTPLDNKYHPSQCFFKEEIQNARAIPILTELIYSEDSDVRRNVGGFFSLLLFYSIPLCMFLGRHVFQESPTEFVVHVFRIELPLLLFTYVCACHNFFVSSNSCVSVCVFGYPSSTGHCCFGQHCQAPWSFSRSGCRQRSSPACRHCHPSSPCSSVNPEFPLQFWYLRVGVGERGNCPSISFHDEMNSCVCTSLYVCVCHNNIVPCCDTRASAFPLPHNDLYAFVCHRMRMP